MQTFDKKKLSLAFDIIVHVECNKRWGFILFIFYIASDSMERFTEKEKDWYTLVDDTGWCALVFRCLQLSSEVIHRLIDNQRSVVVTGWSLQS